MLLIAVKNGLGIVSGDIGNPFFMDPCAGNIWSFCSAELIPRCGAIMVLKQNLYVLKTASNLFHKYFGGFLRDLGCIPYIGYQYLWVHKSGKYEGYDYIATHLDHFIIAANNPSKYMHGIDIHFNFRYISYSPNYHLGN